MPSSLPRLFLARHGDTAWTDSRQHTGRTDVPLNERGIERARELGDWLQQFSFAHVFTSPLRRAAVTCELAGFGAVAEIDSDLVEWDYGELEAKTTKEILRSHPNWELFRDGCPGGESPEQAAARAGRFVTRVKQLEGDVLAFSSAHIIRMIVAAWNGLAPNVARMFFCRPASVGVLAFEHDSLEEPNIHLWNFIIGSDLVQGRSSL